jgi:hypothetical protein
VRWFTITKATQTAGESRTAREFVGDYFRGNAQTALRGPREFSVFSVFLPRNGTVICHMERLRDVGRGATAQTSYMGKAQKLVDGRHKKGSVHRG